MTTLLPINATPQERAVEAALGARTDGLAVPLRDLWNPMTCPEGMLPWLAWGLSIDGWDSAWPINVRRARVATAIAIQRVKGSAQSVKDVVESFGGSVTLREWFQQTPPATPHTFELLMSLGGQDDAAPSADFINAVVAEVGRTKPARSHFTFTVATAAAASMGLRAVVRAISVTRLQTSAE